MLLPISDDNSGRRILPFIVYTLIAINIIVFIIELMAGDSFIAGYSAIPYEITTGKDLIEATRSAHGQVMMQAPGPHPIWLTLFTSMFMHAGFLHIAGNMLYLWIFGDNVEDNFGHFKFIIFYLVCGLAAAFAQIAMDPYSKIPSLGASGAIAGVLGAYLIMFPKNRVRALLPLGFIWTTVDLPAYVVLGFWIVLQLFSQFVEFGKITNQGQGGGVAYMAHIGGFFAGLVLTFIFRKKRPRPLYYVN